MDMDRKKKLLLVLVAIFIAFIFYRILHPFKQERVDQLTYTSKRTRDKEIKKPSVALNKKRSDAQIEVMLDLFRNPPRHDAKIIKNIFQKTIAKKMIKPEDVIQEIETQKPVAAAFKKEDPLELLHRELSSLRVFGLYESKDEKFIFLERGNEVLVVRKGDRIDGKYLIEDITKEKLVLKVMQINEPVYIDISGL